MIIRLLVYILVCCLFGWLLCDINPEETYGWLGGIWQGLFFVPNWIRSWFGSALYIAPLHTAAYSVWYWIFAVISVLGGISTLFGGRR